MAETDLVYFDIAAVVVMLVSLLSFLVRRKTRTPANRVYLSVLVLVTLTAMFALAAELYDAYGASAIRSLFLRNLVAMAYYALRSLTAPAYLVLIATVSDTSYRLNESVKKGLSARASSRHDLSGPSGGPRTKPIIVRGVTRRTSVPLCRSRGCAADRGPTAR